MNGLEILDVTQKGASRPRNMRKEQISRIDSDPHWFLVAYVVFRLPCSALSTIKFTKNSFDAPVAKTFNGIFPPLVMGLSSPYVVVAQFNKQ